MRCTVIGAGVIGLSCAVRLAEAGHAVRVITERPPAETTSAVAAALWYPYLAAPRDRVTRWGKTTYAELVRLAESSPESGVRVRRGYEFFRSAQPDPWWVAAVPDLQRLGPGALRAPYVDGWTFAAPVVDMPHYLDWLAARLSALGVVLEQHRVADLDVELRRADAVINCAGLAAGALADDDTVRPVRGQVVVLGNPGLTEWWLDDETDADLTYVIPRLSSVVVGGTAQPGAQDLEPDPAVADAVLRRAYALVPALREAPIQGHRVGLRPARPEIRLETEERSAGLLVHCYGHGGAGVTLSWGCAEDVRALLS